MLRRCILLLAGALLFAPAASPAAAQTTDAILDSLQNGSFRYFWDEANPANGLIRDRSTPGSVCSIASTGFGLSAICIGVDHGWVTRSAARDRVRTTLLTFWNGPQGSAGDQNAYIGRFGLFYHWLDMNTARRTWDSELSTIDTALLFAGIYDVKQYFDGADAGEVEIRALADSITRRADWSVMRNFSPGIHLGWRRDTGFIPFKWRGYNEAMIIYILAIGAPVTSRGAPASDWSYWTAGYNWNTTTYWPQPYLIFPPLFGHQYSHCWIDFRNIQDVFMQSKGIDYFENSRRATLAQQSYCIANPMGWTGYGDSLWGITASDVPTGYSARGAPPAQNDDGTITPTAPAGSIAFAPEVVLPTLRNLYNTYKSSPLWSKYGFRDAFNLSVNPDWYGTDVLGIDQGPIIIMIENYRTGRVWQRFMRNPEILEGLRRAGFVGPALDVPAAQVANRIELLPAAPTPFSDRTLLRYRLPVAASVRVSILDVMGREVARPVEGFEAAGPHRIVFEANGLASGLYFLRVTAGSETVGRWLVLMR